MKMKTTLILLALLIPAGCRSEAAIEPKPVDYFDPDNSGDASGDPSRKLTDEKIFSDTMWQVEIDGKLCDIKKGIVRATERMAAPFLEVLPDGSYQYKSLKLTQDMPVGTIGIIRMAEGDKSFPDSPYPPKRLHFYHIKTYQDDSHMFCQSGLGEDVYFRLDRSRVDMSDTIQLPSFDGMPLIVIENFEGKLADGTLQQRPRLLLVKLPDVPPPLPAK